MYGFVTMPPMPPVPHEIQERVLGIRQLMQLARQKWKLVICMAPEGRDFTGGVLGMPPLGSGRLIAQLQKYLPNIITVGVYEGEGRLIVKFGQPFSIKLGEKLDSRSIDNMVISRIMTAIAQLLPAHLRGEFAT